jgi:ABC-type nitrate/sulfonate/bicarbonate transport system substrate-binding protein
MLRTLDLLASDPSHLPFLFVFKESRVMEKYGFEIDLHIVGGAKAPTMAHRAKLALAGEIDFLSGLHHETYRERAKGEKRLTYLAQAQNNWDDRLVALPTIRAIEDLKDKKIICHAKAPCVAGNLRAVLETCGLRPEEIRIEAVEDSSGKFLEFVDRLTGGEAVAALVDMPFDLYGVKKGLKIVDLPDRPVIHNTTLLATTDYIKQNEETVVAFIKGFIEALHFFKTQPDKVIPILKKNLAQRYGLEEDEYYIHLQREWARLLSKKPYPLASAIQNVYDLDVGKDPAMRHIGPMEPWDLHYLRAIDDSGFIDRLYAS